MKPTLVSALFLASVIAACAVDSDAPPIGDPFAALPHQAYRYALPDGRVAVGTGVRQGDTLLIEGDVVIPAEPSRPGTSDAAVAYNLWPSKVIRYQFDPNLDAATRQRVLDAMQPWRAAGIRFLQRTTQASFITITTGYFAAYPWVCAATVGYQATNTYYAGSACRTHDYVHEWGHVLGLFHEHSRTDRASYVWTDPSLGGTIAGAGYDSGYYDFDSVMHYDAWARNYDGSIDYNTVLIQPLDGRPLWSFGFTESPSSEDLNTIYWLYWTEPPCGPGTGQICP